MFAEGAELLSSCCCWRKAEQTPSCRNQHFFQQEKRSGCIKTESDYKSEHSERNRGGLIYGLDRLQPQSHRPGSSRKQQAPTGQFAIPLARGHSRTEVNQPACHPSMANLVICPFQSPVVQDPTQFPDAAVAFPPPPSHVREKKGREGRYTHPLKL